MPLIVGFVLTLDLLRDHRPHHRDRRGATGAQEPRPASLRALDARARADDPDGHRDRMEHGAAAFPAHVRRSAAAASSTRSSGCRSSPASATIVGLELLYRHTLVGRAFLAIAEDNFAARALGLPERNLRMASYALAGVIGGLAGFCRRRSCCSPSSPMDRCSTSTASSRSRSAGSATIAARSSAASRSACSSRRRTSWSAASSRRSPCSRCSSSCCSSRPQGLFGAQTTRRV